MFYACQTQNGITTRFVQVHHCPSSSTRALIPTIYGFLGIQTEYGIKSRNTKEKCGNKYEKTHFSLFFFLFRFFFILEPQRNEATWCSCEPPANITRHSHIFPSPSCIFPGNYREFPYMGWHTKRSLKARVSVIPKKGGARQTKKLGKKFFFSKNLKSRCHTKRRAGTATRARPSFGLTPTQAIMDLFSWKNYLTFPYFSLSLVYFHVFFQVNLEVHFSTNITTVFFLIWNLKNK